MILVYLCFLNLVHGLRLHTGQFHNKSNFHIIAQLPGGIDGTGVRFVNCDPDCSSGTVFFNTYNLTNAPRIRWQRISTTSLYDIQYTVPPDQQKQYIDMIIRPSGCTESSCEMSEESYPECGRGHILDATKCRICEAGKYQEEILCKTCVSGKTSGPGVQTCIDEVAPPSKRTEIRQTMTFEGINVTQMEEKREPLRVWIATTVGVPLSSVVIEYIGTALTRLSSSGGATLSTTLSTTSGGTVIVEYYIIVLDEKQVEVVKNKVISFGNSIEEVKALFKGLVDVAFGVVEVRRIDEDEDEDEDNTMLIGSVIVLLSIIILSFYIVKHTTTTDKATKVTKTLESPLIVSTRLQF